MAGPFDNPLIPAPPEWTQGSRGSTIGGGDEGAKPADPLAAWDQFWRAIGRDLPRSVNRTRKLSRALRQSRLR